MERNIVNVKYRHPPLTLLVLEVSGDHDMLRGPTDAFTVTWAVAKDLPTHSPLAWAVAVCYLVYGTR